MSYRNLLIITLWLIALHSISVGIGMIVLPSNVIKIFDIVPSEHRFFITQGGVFHLVMAIAYAMAALDIKTNKVLINYAIIVKFCATAFLLYYFICVNQFGIVFLSGIGDFCMGVLLLVINKKYRAELTA
jgi:hypothetical protein